MYHMHIVEAVMYHVHIAEAVMTELQWLLHVHAWMRVGHTARVLSLHGSLSCQDTQDITPVGLLFITIYLQFCMLAGTRSPMQ